MNNVLRDFYYGDPKFLTPAQVAKDLQVSSTTVAGWVDMGIIPGIRINSVVRIPAAWFLKIATEWGEEQ
ncbi:MAG: hypothetical protein C7B46_19860 [Sulfobacillus benefaciens]|uniref:DNA-binding protein n=1 Tax=Sulfobacillus benefaciens TaxID=453960 RepID=A0A2T2WWH5_9FIRM|nr:MAG: hypothetical protein C7B46_19860 [Sulfobacillus benefaciens]